MDYTYGMRLIKILFYQALLCIIAPVTFSRRIFWTEIFGMASQERLCGMRRENRGVAGTVAIFQSVGRIFSPLYRTYNPNISEIHSRVRLKYRAYKYIYY